MFSALWACSLEFLHFLTGIGSAGVLRWWGRRHRLPARALTNPTAPRMPPTQPTPDCPQCTGPSDLSAVGCVPARAAWAWSTPPATACCCGRWRSSSRLPVSRPASTEAAFSAKPLLRPRWIIPISAPYSAWRSGRGSLSSSRRIIPAERCATGWIAAEPCLSPRPSKSRPKWPRGWPRLMPGASSTAISVSPNYWKRRISPRPGPPWEPPATWLPNKYRAPKSARRRICGR
jgi:hypothetical protein